MEDMCILNVRLYFSVADLISQAIINHSCTEFSFSKSEVKILDFLHKIF